MCSFATPSLTTSSASPGCPPFVFAGRDDGSSPSSMHVGVWTDAASARADLSDARANRATLQRNLDDITKKLERTHLGPEFEYQPLADQCYTLENKEYVELGRIESNQGPVPLALLQNPPPSPKQATAAGPYAWPLLPNPPSMPVFSNPPRPIRFRYVYEVCMFNKVEQRKITGGGNTRLGYVGRAALRCARCAGWLMDGKKALRDAAETGKDGSRRRASRRSRTRAVKSAGTARIGPPTYAPSHPVAFKGSGSSRAACGCARRVPSTGPAAVRPGDQADQRERAGQVRVRHRHDDPCRVLRTHRRAAGPSRRRRARRTVIVPCPPSPSARTARTPPKVVLDLYTI